MILYLKFSEWLYPHEHVDTLRSFAAELVGSPWEPTPGSKCRKFPASTPSTCWPKNAVEEGPGKVPQGELWFTMIYLFFGSRDSVWLRMADGWCIENSVSIFPRLRAPVLAIEELWPGVSWCGKVPSVKVPPFWDDLWSEVIGIRPALHIQTVLYMMYGSVDTHTHVYIYKYTYIHIYMYHNYMHTWYIMIYWYTRSLLWYFRLLDCMRLPALARACLGFDRWGRWGVEAFVHPHPDAGWSWGLLSRDATRSDWDWVATMVSSGEHMENKPDMMTVGWVAWGHDGSCSICIHLHHIFPGIDLLDDLQPPKAINIDKSPSPNHPTIFG